MLMPFYIFTCFVETYSTIDITTSVYLVYVIWYCARVGLRVREKEYHDVSVIRADNQHLDKESSILTPTSVTIL